MSNADSRGFLWPPRSTIRQATLFLGSNKRNTEGKSATNAEVTKVKKQDQTKFKQLVTWRIHINNIHTKLIYTGEDRMFVDRIT